MATNFKVCEVWQPKGKKATKPNNIGNFKPLYPVYLYRSSPTSFKRSWFWLWECLECGGEVIMSTDYIEQDTLTCTCSNNTINLQKSVYPLATEQVCEACGEKFTYSKKHAKHSVRFCSKFCISMYKSSLQGQLLEEHKQYVRLDFDRVSFCMRKQGPAYDLCDKYHKCQDHRWYGHMGPFYIANGECYTFSGINTI